MLVVSLTVSDLEKEFVMIEMESLNMMDYGIVMNSILIS